MSYLQGRREKRKKFQIIAAIVVVVVILFFVRHPIFKAFSYVGHTVFRPLLVGGRNSFGALGGLGSMFSSKSTLSQENESLKLKLSEQEARLANYDSVVSENTTLKETLGRKVEQPLILAAILSKPNQSPYDTLVIDIGSDLGVKAGSIVFAKGSIPIGRVAEVYYNSSKIILFSNTGEKTKVVMSGSPTQEENKDLFIDIIGRGGNNFEMILPRDFVVEKGEQVVLPGINPHLVAVVETIISDPRDAFKKALLVAPVNIQELKFVEVEK